MVFRRLERPTVNVLDDPRPVPDGMSDVLFISNPDRPYCLRTSQNTGSLISTMSRTITTTEYFSCVCLSSKDLTAVR